MLRLESKAIETHYITALTMSLGGP